MLALTYRLCSLEIPQSAWQNCFDNWFKRMQKCILVDFNRVPLHSRAGLKLRSKIIGDPTFNIKLYSGMPDKSSEFKNSVGKLTALLSSQTVLLDLYDTKFSGNNCCIFKFKLSTSGFFAAKIALSARHS
uniref:Uncharacterized protein n=1 Tax=Bactrocera latifrons TaxID=174628 RepID=A0A0K8VY97_BACLA